MCDTSEPDISRYLNYLRDSFWFFPTRNVLRMHGIPVRLAQMLTVKLLPVCQTWRAVNYYLCVEAVITTSYCSLIVEVGR